MHSCFDLHFILFYTYIRSITRVTSVSQICFTLLHISEDELIAKRQERIVPSKKERTRCFEKENIMPYVNIRRQAGENQEFIIRTPDQNKRVFSSHRSGYTVHYLPRPNSPQFTPLWRMESSRNSVSCVNPPEFR